MSVEDLQSMLSMYRRPQVGTHPQGGTAINSAAIITDLEDARFRMNAYLDEVIPPRYKNATVEHPQILEWVTEYAQNPAEARSLLIMGPTGSGKTWAGYGALRAAVTLAMKPNRVGRYVLGTWMATTHPDFLAHMRPGYYGQREEMSAERYMTMMRETRLLMFDDLGVTKGSEFAEEVTHRLISGRYDDQRPTIYTTNHTAKSLEDAVGGRVTSRLVGQCFQVKLLVEDRRRKGQ